MASTRKNESWLLVDWVGGGRDVIYVRSVLSPMSELKIGEVLTANKRGEAQIATLIARARERHELDEMIKEKASPGPSVENQDDPEDFSASASSWDPNDEDEPMSGDSDEVKTKRIKLEPCKRQYSNRRTSRKVLTPIHRPNAVIPKCMLNNTKNENKTRKMTVREEKNTSANKSVPDSTKINTTKNVIPEKVPIDIRELADIRNSFHQLFQMIEELKKPFGFNVNQNAMVSVQASETPSPIENTKDTIVDLDEEQEFENNESDFDRSDDNVLITNKYDNNHRSTVKTSPQNETSEWIPIGSGQTLIHADQYKKIKWKSFTIATRTLLLALFPRRVLATHSLTGKRSPAFQNKPAKMCLDPKIISDVILEVMDRFDVKENLVRSIITTKCADECKMWKTRVMKKKSGKNQENIPPTKNGDHKIE
ncbi:hypothetical protein K1T71_009667 [Dendrolimus kikuchii]|uniref:Uncharacterized protein n=1 Tax=Dendrolimus kikuchii TaxID=765133 RepID=A0ACC1CSA7_9NEOP|nr:hypothetical protein K1T71_009667 [Dendrolimus kikuchii]